MRLTEAIRPECLCTGLSCTDRDDVLRQAASLAKKSNVLRAIPEERILQGFHDRESLSTTGIGDGVALPHCRIPGVPDFVVGLITLAAPVDFQSVDKKPVRIVAFIVGPESDTVDHPRILSGLSLRLATAESRQKIMAAPNSEQLLDLLALSEAKREPAPPTPAQRLVYVIAQEADIFHHVLETIESIDGAMAVVIESTNAGALLARLPVFAGFLTDSPNQFSRVILSTVPKNLTNELIRRIEMTAGPLDDHEDIAVIVQDVFLMTGTLSI